MNLTRARQLASQGYSMRDAARELGMRVLQLTTLAERHGIRFRGEQRESQWEKPEGDAEAVRQYWTGQIRNATCGNYRGRRPE
jgi:ribosomal protein L32E